jgi:hypothetical protein
MLEPFGMRSDCTATADRHLGGMRAANHVDGRRALQPRAYLPPHTFGMDPTAAVSAPTGGDDASARIAWLQHQLACRYRARGSRPSGAELGRTFGFSRSVFSESLRGNRWMGESVMAALLTATR